MTRPKDKPRSLQSTRELKSILQQYFSELEEASSTESRKKIAWCTSIGPCELLHAMRFEVYYPENHGALLGIKPKCSDQWR